MRRLKFLTLFIWSLSLLGWTWFTYPVPIHGLATVAHSAAAALGLLLLALLSGRAVLRRFRLYHGDVVEELVLSLAVGLVLVSFLGEALGALGVLYPWTAWGAVVLGCLVCWGHGEAIYDWFKHALRGKHAWEASASEIAALLSLGLAGVSILAMVLAPPKFFDALVYHFSMAQRAAETGFLAPQPGVFFTWLPSLPVPVWSLALALDGAPTASAVAPALVNLALAAALGLLLMEVAGRLCSERRLWLAPALALTQPILLLGFAVFAPDGWAAFFAFASLAAFLRATDETAASDASSWMLLSAGLAGAAAASKIVALNHAFALGALALVLVWKERRWRKPALWLAAAGLFGVPLLPWLIQGAVRLGQPFYPFPVRLFGWTFAEGGPAAYFRHLDTFGGEGWQAWLRLPWAAFFDTGSLGADGHPGILLLALAPAALVWRWEASKAKVGVYVALGAAFWLLGPHVLRYALFLVAPAALLAAHGVLEAETWAFSRTWTFLWRALVAVALFSAAAESLAIVGMDFRPFEAALGIQPAEDYLFKEGVPQARASRWIRDQGVSDPGVLVIGDQRSAYLPPRALVSSAFEEHPLASWVAAASRPEDVGAAARSKGYDFVFINGAEWQRLDREGNGPRYWPEGDAASRERFFAWMDSLRALPAKDRFEAPGVLVARLR